MFHDLGLLDPVQVDVEAGLAAMRPPGGEEDTAALPEDERDFVDGPVAREARTSRSRRNAATPSATPGSWRTHRSPAEVSREHVVPALDVERLVTPVGLCAWILDKFYAWSDHGPDQRLPFTPDTLLANVTLYWVTQTIYSSIAIYRGNARRPLAFGPGDYVRVPTAFAQFPRELPTPPRAEVEQGYNLQRWTAMPAGGHSAALEQPALLGCVR